MVGSCANDFERVRVNVTVHIEDIVVVVLELSGGGREGGRGEEADEEAGGRREGGRCEGGMAGTVGRWRDQQV